MTFTLVSFTVNDDVKLGIQTADGIVLAPAELAQWPNMLNLFDDWGTRAYSAVMNIDVGRAPEVRDAQLTMPIRYPRKVICAGVNYRKHIKEMGGDVPSTGWYPFFFMKPPTTTIIGPTDPILLHNADRLRYDWEAELAVIIGIGGRDIPASDALQHVAGYSVANDVTARGAHKRAAVPAPAFIYDWFSSKAVDGSLPLGPGITPAFFVPDPQKLQVQLWVNDVLEQDESTDDMICTVAELISAASAVVTLEPGDVIITGTPSGVGSSQGRHLVHGDVVRVAIQGLGSISNAVVEAERAAT